MVTELASRHPERTVFTRFIPSGTGHRHARHVAAILLALEGCDAPATRSRSPGAAIACQALSIDKERHPAFVEPHLSEFLHAIEADGLIVTGSETDVCVLATVLCAVDLGYRVIVVRDVVCSSDTTRSLPSSASATPSRWRSPTLLPSWSVGNPEGGAANLPDLNKALDRLF